MLCAIRSTPYAANSMQYALRITLSLLCVNDLADATICCILSEQIIQWKPVFSTRPGMAGGGDRGRNVLWEGYKSFGHVEKTFSKVLLGLLLWWSCHQQQSKCLLTKRYQQYSCERIMLNILFRHSFISFTPILKLWWTLRCKMGLNEFLECLINCLR